MVTLSDMFAKVDVYIMCMCISVCDTVFVCGRVLRHVESRSWHANHTRNFFITIYKNLETLAQCIFINCQISSEAGQFNTNGSECSLLGCILSVVWAGRW